MTRQTNGVGETNLITRLEKVYSSHWLSSEPHVPGGGKLGRSPKTGYGLEMETAIAKQVGGAATPAVSSAIGHHLVQHL